MSLPLKIRLLGQQDYQHTWQAMRRFTDQRDQDSVDELWLLEHPSVFTQGQAGKSEHILHKSNIPIVPTDRGGQVTYHGPGQLMAYTLFNLQRLALSTRAFVIKLEQSVIAMLKHYEVSAYGRREAPGIYIDQQKIASIGLRVRRGRSYHGIAINIDMDLTPFSHINPCGYADLHMTQLADCLNQPNHNLFSDASQQFTRSLMENFGYTRCTYEQTLPTEYLDAERTTVRS